MTTWDTEAVLKLENPCLFAECLDFSTLGRAYINRLKIIHVLRRIMKFDCFLNITDTRLHTHGLIKTQN